MTPDFGEIYPVMNVLRFFLRLQYKHPPSINPFPALHSISPPCPVPPVTEEMLSETKSTNSKQISKEEILR